MPTVPTVNGRQVESRGFQSPGLQAFDTPQTADVLGQAAEQYAGAFAQAKQRADVAQAQDASLQLSQISSDLLTNPDTGLLNMQGKNALGKGQEYTQEFDSKVEQIAMTLPESARAGFMQQAQQQRVQFTSQAGRHEITQLNAYEEGQFQATLANNGKLAASAYADNANYVLYNQQTFQQIEDYGAAHGWSQEQIQAKKIEFKEKVADASLSQWSANNAIDFIHSNGELSDTATGSRRAVSEGGVATVPAASGTITPATSSTAKPTRGLVRLVMMGDLLNSKLRSMVSARWAATCCLTRDRALIPSVTLSTAGRRRLTTIIPTHISRRYVLSSELRQISNSTPQTLTLSKRCAPLSSIMKTAASRILTNSFLPASARPSVSLSCRPAPNATPATRHSTPHLLRHRPHSFARQIKSASSSRRSIAPVSTAGCAMPARHTCAA